MTTQESKEGPGDWAPAGWPMRGHSGQQKPHLPGLGSRGITVLQAFPQQQAAQSEAPTELHRQPRPLVQTAAVSVWCTYWFKARGKPPFSQPTGQIHFKTQTTCLTGDTAICNQCNTDLANIAFCYILWHFSPEGNKRRFLFPHDETSLRITCTFYQQVEREKGLGKRGRAPKSPANQY